MLALAFLLSLTSGVLILLTARCHIRFSADHHDGVQKVHTRITPRVGGLAFMLALLGVWEWGMDWPALQLDLTDLSRLLGALIVSALPAFCFGLMEDLTGRIGPLSRLLATAFSGLMAWWVTGYALTDVDVWGLDWLLQWMPLAVLFTTIAVAGLANGMNMIDGANGLASGVAGLAFFVFGLIAWRLGDLDLHLLCLAFAGATLGFFVINWPWGRLFLGDGGAYLIGFLLAWVAVMLKERHPQISAWSISMVLMYPLTEAVFTIYRRVIRRQHPGLPDSLHLHSLLHRRLVNTRFVGHGSMFRNSLTGFLIIAMSAFGQALACWTLFSQSQSLAAWAGLLLLYLLLYTRLVYFRWMLPWKLLTPRRKSASAL